MGVSYFSDYSRYGEFNIRKFQMKYSDVVTVDKEVPVGAMEAVGAVGSVSTTNEGSVTVEDVVSTTVNEDV